MAFNSYKQEDSGAGSGQYPSTQNSSSSFLGKTIEIKGEITSDEYLTIEGKVTGNITISKTLTVGKNGLVNGQIKADAVKIDGKVDGHVDASGKLEITAGGNFTGTMKTDKLVIEEGAVFKGNVNLDE